MKAKLMLEICPPSNPARISELYNRISHLIRMIEGISIPSKYTGTNIGCGFERAYKFAEYLREKGHLGLNILLHVTCFDLNRHNIYQRLERLNSISVDQILVVTGDNYQSYDKNKHCHFLNSSQLVNHILSECNWQGSVAVAAYPGNELEEECSRLCEKIKTGSNTIYTQCIFDAKQFGQFVRRLLAEVNGVEIIPSVALFKDRLSLKGCHTLIRVEENNELDGKLSKLNTSDCEAYIEKYLTQLCKELSEISKASTINICTFNQFGMAERLISNLAKLDS